MISCRWKPEGWEDCSQTCNGGNRTREVKCMQIAADGIEYDVDTRLCSDPKPSMVEACNNVPCPAEWVAQPFGQVSTTSLTEMKSKRNKLKHKT